jgi:hypothetical protein
MRSDGPSAACFSAANKVTTNPRPMVTIATVYLFFMIFFVLLFGAAKP